MKTPNLCIVVCEDFRREIDTVLRHDPPTDTIITTFPPLCRRSPQEWECLQEMLREQHRHCGAVCVFGGRCLRKLGTLFPNTSSFQVVQRDRCAELVTDPAVVASHNHGACPLTPGLLERWWNHRNTCPIEQQVTACCSDETPTSLVLFDTGVDPIIREKMRVCGEEAGLPWEIVPVGTSYFDLLVRNHLLTAQRYRQEHAAQETVTNLNQRVSNYEMLFDLIGDMTRMRTETEVIDAIFDLFAMMYSPRSQRYIPVHGGVPGTIRARPPNDTLSDEDKAWLLEETQEYRWLETDDGFTLRITYRDELMGMLSVEGFAFTTYREHYLNNALMLVKVCGLAIRNARTYEQLGTSLDELRVTTDKLYQAKDAAEAANRAKSEFLANMSHEIRTPLNAIIGMTDLLLDSELNTEQNEFIETVHSSGHALLSIINDILDFSKIEAGKIELEQRPFNLRQCIEESLDLVILKADEKQINLAYQIDERLPAYLMGDITRVRQILFNILSNAVKFTEHGEVFVLAEPADTPPDDIQATFGVHISVRDTGIGIPQQLLGRLFQSFVQGDSSTTRKYGGTGLGLAISRRFAEMMGGTIWAESEPDQGSTFHIQIRTRAAPPDYVPEEHDQPDEYRVRREEHMPLLKGKQVLVYSQHESNRRMILHYTRMWDMQGEATDTMTGMLESVCANPQIDSVILDFLVVDETTLTFLRQLRQACRQRTVPPTIVFLPINQRSKMSNHPEIAVDAFLSRPIKPGLLLHALSMLLSGNTDVVVTDTHQRQRTQQAATQHREQAQATPLRLLLAEDNLFNQKFALRLLERIGYKADTATSGLDVLAALEQQPYDIILMDVQMPHLDGLDTTQRIRADTSPALLQPYIIAMTANAMQGDREMCLEAGMDDYVSKPVEIDALLAALNRALDYLAQQKRQWE